MKNFNQYLLIIFVGISILTIKGCEDAPSGLDDEPETNASIYMSNASESPHLLELNDKSDNIFTFKGSFEGSDFSKNDVTVNFSIDSEMVQSFNEENSTSYSILPEENYRLSENEATIPAGKISTPTLELKVNLEPDLEDTEYILPISISTESEGVSVNPDLKTSYLIVENIDDKENGSLDIVITGLMVNPSGADSPEEGDTKEYKNGTKIVFEGGHEYIQLMALKDIDFSETPYSVVVGRNYRPHTNGWASGTTKSFKFNLTEGQAEKGTFFYVGGASKRIYGYSSEGYSTDISDANWIRALQTNIGSGVAGDGFGESTAGLLTNSKEHATGVAVFSGTEIESSTIPMDAVFYGENVGDALNNEGGTTNGYRVPEETDLYSMYNPDTNEEQFLFGQGGNTYMVGEVMSGGFAQMGGVFNSNGIVEDREWSIIDLQIDSELSDIEGGPGATMFEDN